MTLAVLKADLQAILSLEERVSVDWRELEERCLKLRLRLSKLGLGDADFAHEIYHYLSDADIRRKDAVYAAAQRAELRKWLDDGAPPG